MNSLLLLVASAALVSFVHCVSDPLVSHELEESPPSVPGTKFKWIDSSCARHVEAINTAVEEVVAMTTSVENVLPIDDKSLTLVKDSFAAFWGSPAQDRTGIAIKGLKYSKIKRAASAVKIPINLYCDGSAFEWVTTYQEDAKSKTESKTGNHKKGDLISGGGKWYVKRRDAEEPPLYISGDHRPDFCSINGNPVQGIALPSHPYVVLCPDSFNKKNTLDAIKAHPPKIGNLDIFLTTGVVLLHEMGHAILGLPGVLSPTLPEQYQYRAVTNLAKKSPLIAFRNADNYALFAMAIYLSEYNWSITGGLGYAKLIVQPAAAPAAVSDKLDVRSKLSSLFHLPGIGSLPKTSSIPKEDGKPAESVESESGTSPAKPDPNAKEGGKKETTKEAPKTTHSETRTSSRSSTTTTSSATTFTTIEIATEAVDPSMTVPPEKNVVRDLPSATADPTTLKKVKRNGPSTTPAPCDA